MLGAHVLSVRTVVLLACSVACSVWWMVLPALVLAVSFVLASCVQLPAFSLQSPPLAAKFDESDASLDSEHEEERFERWYDDYPWL